MRERLRGKRNRHESESLSNECIALQVQLTVNEVQASKNRSGHDLVVHESVHGILSTTIENLEGEGQALGEDVGLESSESEEEMSRNRKDCIDSTMSERVLQVMSIKQKMAHIWQLRVCNDAKNLTQYLRGRTCRRQTRHKGR